MSDEIMGERPLSEAFLKLAEFCLAMGVKGLGNLPEPWTHQIDDQWYVAVNGAAFPRKAKVHARGGMAHEVEVPAFTAYIEFNGWPAGFMDPYGGGMAMGEAANEDTFIAALEKGIENSGS